MMRKISRTSEALTAGKALALASLYLDKRQPVDYRMVCGRVECDGDWWCVQVQPDRSGVSSGDFTDRLVDAKMALQEQQNANVMLAVMLPSAVAEAEMLLPRVAAVLVKPQRNERRKTA